MTIRTAAAPVLLSDLTTIGLGGPALRLIEASTADEVADAVRSADADSGTGEPTEPGTSGEPRKPGETHEPGATGALILGGGSNLIVADEGVAVPVVRIAVPGIEVRPVGARADDGGGVLVTVGAGEAWDDVVATLVADGYSGIETLSGIPGSAGATPVQNVGAYGTEISSVLVDVTVYDRRRRALRTVPAAELHLGYRTSVLRGADAAVVTSLRIRLGRAARPVRYAELARALGVQVGTPVPAPEVREAVLGLRRSKGMVLDPADPDTRSVGSFFTNPVLTPDELAATDRLIRERFGPDASYPRYPGAAGNADAADTKLSAAWLIERAGFSRGLDGPGGQVGVSGKHTLALVNRGGGTTAELLTLARQIRDGVRDAFAVALLPEPVLVGVEF